jgi:hypothetical protein
VIALNGQHHESLSLQGSNTALGCAPDAKHNGSHKCGWATATKASKANWFHTETFARQGAKGSQGCHQYV